MRIKNLERMGIVLIAAFCLSSVGAHGRTKAAAATSSADPCPPDNLPVCGANGVTYTNTCFAGSIVIAYSGACCADADGDRVCDSDDQCTGNDAWGDEDGDGVCEDIDACLGNDALGDSDGDGSCDDADLCIGDDRYGDLDGDGTCEELDGVCGGPDTGDYDGDGVCNSDDICPNDAYMMDADLDGVCNGLDNCPNDRYEDRDHDGCCDSQDLCPLDDANDGDGDGFCANNDLCLGFNDTGDSDGDGFCDDLDLCVGDDANGDTDSDGICDVLASCDDLSGTDWGSCAPHPLGAAVIGTACQMIFGCEIPPGITLFANVTECAANCTGCADNSQCAQEEYCKFPDDDPCGMASFGSCSPRAEVCAQIWDPVCGCDNRTHSSYCHADAAGVNAAYYGECGSTCTMIGTYGPADGTIINLWGSGLDVDHLAGPSSVTLYQYGQVYVSHRTFLSFDTSSMEGVTFDKATLWVKMRGWYDIASDARMRLYYGHDAIGATLDISDWGSCDTYTGTEYDPNALQSGTTIAQSQAMDFVWVRFDVPASVINVLGYTDLGLIPNWSGEGEPPLDPLWSLYTKAGQFPKVEIAITETFLQIQ